MLGFEPDELGQAAAVELICCCHKKRSENLLLSTFSSVFNITFSSVFNDKPLPTAELRASAESRARSSCLCADIQRVCSTLFRFFKSLEGIVKGHKRWKRSSWRHGRAMLLTTAVVYLFLRLSPEYRVKFLSRIECSAHRALSTVADQALFF